MGILNKFKNMFTEEIEEEIDEPVKKEMISVEIPSPIERERKTIKEKEEKPTPKVDRIVENREIRPSKKDVSPTRTRENTTSPRREEVLSKPKEEEKFTFPVFFDDDDFDTLDKKVEKKEERKVEPYGGKKKEIKKEDTSKKFKPTPIISPIYGVLDKNYKKEDITNKINKTSSSRSHKEMTIDDLRKKAYGTLEDDLESGLLNDTAYDKPAVFREETDMFDDLSMFEDDFLTPPYETRSANTEENMVKQELEKNVDEKAETDLFNLIDSMYEKGDRS